MDPHDDPALTGTGVEHLGCCVRDRALDYFLVHAQMIAFVLSSTSAQATETILCSTWLHSSQVPSEDHLIGAANKTGHRTTLYSE
jgi:hypothetical protein